MRANTHIWVTSTLNVRKMYPFVPNPNPWIPDIPPYSPRKIELPVNIFKFCKKVLFSKVLRYMNLKKSKNQ